jgi:protein-S-isoprenylcysteine O-methyltransferase Ste14
MIVDLVFGITLVFELLLGTALLVSLTYPKYRLWPPPKKESWQYWYVHFSTESSILCFFALGFLDWNTFFLKHWLRFIFAPLFIAVGAIIFLWALRTLTLNTSLGAKGKLTNEGLYRYLRNPQYLGTVLFFSGTMLLFNSLYQIVTGTIGIIWFLLAAFVEEAWLRDQFKEEYDTYRKEVPRFMFKPIKVRAAFFVPLIVLATVSFFFALGYLVTLIFRIPFSLALPLSARMFGLLLIAIGFAFLAWLFRYRKPIDVVVSTYVTFVKAVKRIPLGTQSGRTEPLRIIGPYRHVRHPIYFSVFLLLLGWWMMLDYSFLFFSAVLLLLWFKFVVVPFEEKELVAIFGGQYESYTRKVPSLIPFTRCHKTNESS